MNANLGRFRKHLSKPCPDCGAFSLELRVYGEKEKIICSRCEYQEFVVPKRIRRREEIEEVVIEPPRRNFRPVSRHA